MTEIIPAILPKSYEDLVEKLKTARGLVPVVQVDLCDGRYVDNKTWPWSEGGTDEHFKRILNEEEGMPFWEDLDFELDLMVSDAVENFDLYMKLGARRMIFHLEAMENVEEFREFVEGIDNFVRDCVEIGVAVLPTTPMEKISKVVSIVDFVQVMGIERIGFQGEEFSDEAYGQIKKLKEKDPDLVIACDGGINQNNAAKILESGASRLAIGSAIWNSDDIIGAIEEFSSVA
jgi:ribulose-phosphate 3-epimerase